jgi:hypothetical protein
VLNNLNGYVTNPNPTLTLTPISLTSTLTVTQTELIKNPKRNDFKKSIGQFAGRKIVLTTLYLQMSNYIWYYMNYNYVRTADHFIQETRNIRA